MGHDDEVVQAASQPKPAVGAPTGATAQLQPELSPDGSAIDKETQHDRISVTSSSVSAAGIKGKEDAAAPENQTGATVDPEAAFAHLPGHEREILKRQIESQDVSVSFIGLYRYATKVDLLIILVSALCAIAAGAALPLFTVSGTAEPLVRLDNAKVICRSCSVRWLLRCEASSTARSHTRCTITN